MNPLKNLIRYYFYHLYADDSHICVCDQDFLHLDIPKELQIQCHKPDLSMSILFL